MAFGQATSPASALADFHFLYAKAYIMKPGFVVFSVEQNHHCHTE
jgi:hypothetical protein